MPWPISCGKPTAVSKLAPTLEAKLCPVQATCGTPAHKASLAVVCAL